MKPKKNPKADLNRDSGLYFVIGLTLVLFVVWRALELKTYDRVMEDTTMNQMAEPDLREEVPITEMVKTPPPPAPPAAPVIIEVVEDTEEIEETIIQSSETDQNAEIQDVVISVDEVNVDEVEEEITVPFAVIEDIPVFPGCEEGTKAEKRACFQNMVQEHVRKNFQYPAAAVELNIQGKVYVQFVIDTEGRVDKIQTRGPDRILEGEAERIIAKLPRMKPGMQRGRPVKVPYSIPIAFKIM